MLLNLVIGTGALTVYVDRASQMRDAVTDKSTQAFFLGYFIDSEGIYGRFPERNHSYHIYSSTFYPTA